MQKISAVTPQRSNGRPRWLDFILHIEALSFMDLVVISSDFGLLGVW